MKKIAVFFAAALLGGVGFAEEVYEIRDASAKSEIRIINMAGEVEVEGWSRKQVEVEADLGGGIKELIFEVDGNEVLIEVKVPNNHGHHVSSDLVIRVPEGSSLLEIGTVSADITVENVHGRQTLETVSGDIETEVFESDFAVESVSGDIAVEGDDKEARARANSVSGDIDVENLKGEIEVSSVSGDLVLYNSKFENVDAQTVNGDVIFESALYGESRMNVETVNGEVDIDFSGEVSARFDIETFNGDIDNCFGPEAQRTSKYTPGSELKFTVGGGEGRVVIRTLNGDLRLCYTD